MEFFDILASAALISLLMTVISIAQDMRRFRNGVYLLITMLITAAWALLKFQDTQYASIILIVMLGFIVFMVVIVPFLLIINGIIMIRREGHSLSNLLSLLFGIMIFAGEFLLFRGMSHGLKPFSFLHLTELFLGHCVFYASMVFLAFMFYTFFIRIIPKRADFDYIIVLGCGLLQGDKVSKLLADRLDKAVKIYHRSDADCKIIVSGGQGADETMSEAEAMKGYLLEKRIHEKDIIKEDRSTDTMENLKFSREIIRKRGGRQYTAVTTSGYHVFRAMIYARQLSFPVTGIGAHTALYYWPSAMIREYAALVKYYFVPYTASLLITFACLLAVTF